MYKRKCKNRTLPGTLMIVACCAGIGVAQAPASSRDQLQQYVTQLQANPSDDSLRTKAIELALNLDPKPAAPAEAAVAAAKGKTIFASATSPEDLKAAAAAFGQASNLAPWVPDYYYNEGLALEKAKQFDDAVRALNFYLLSAPNASDVADVRGKIEGIRYEKDSAARQEAQEAQTRAAADAERQESMLRDALAGKWSQFFNGQQTAWGARFRLTGTSLNVTYGAGPGGTFTDSVSIGNATLSGHTFEGQFTNYRGIERDECLIGHFLGTISPDNRTIYLSVSFYVNPRLSSQDRAIFSRANGLSCKEEHITLQKVEDQ